MAKNALSYRPDIDGLRAIAVLSVIFFHANFSGFKGGFVGVDIFFVISGFLITSFLTRQIEETGRIAFLDFYAKRIKRLFPAIAVVIISMLLFWAIFLIGVEQDTNRFVKSVRYALFGFANFFFQKNTGGYFDGTSDEMPLLHFWSLAVEEQFYLVWPLLILLTFKRSKRRLMTALSVIAVSSFALALWSVSRGNQNFAFYSMPTRAWELCAGALMTFISPHLKVKSRFLAEIISGLAFLAIACAVYFTSDRHFPGWVALLPVGGASLLILSGMISGQTLSYSFLSSKPMVRIGLLSYGMYLWHWPFFSMAKIMYLGELPPLLFRVFVIVASFFLAELSLKFVEQPVRFGKFFSTWSSRKVIIFAGASACFIVVLSLGVRFQEYQFAQKNKDFTTMIWERSPIYIKCDGVKAIGLPECTEDFSGGDHEKVNIMVWGSSHAGTIFPMLEDYGKKVHVPVSLVSRGGGPTGLMYGDQFFMDDEKQTAEMKAFNLSVFENIKKRVQVNHEKVSVLIIPRWMQYSGHHTMCPTENLEYSDRSQTIDGTLDVVRDALERTFTALTSIGIKRILVMLPYPEYKYNVIRCSMRAPAICATTRKDMEAYRGGMVQTILSVVKKYPNVRTFDPVEKICTQEICPEVLEVNGRMVPVVVDDDHPSGEMGRILGGKIKSDLDWLVEEK